MISQKMKRNIHVHTTYIILYKFFVKESIHGQQYKSKL